MKLDDDEKISIESYFDTIRRYEQLSEDELKKLITNYRNGDKSAWKTLVNSNLRLVVTIASKFVGRGLSIMDLIQEGNIGLLRALKKYDVNKSNKFCTYASYWILRDIYRAIEDYSGLVHIPRYMHKHKKIYKDSYHKLSLSLGREPSMEELSIDTGLSESQLKNVINALTVDVVVSSEVKILDETELKDTFEDKNITTEEENDKHIFLTKDLKKYLSRLRPVERQVLIHRYGLFGASPKPWNLIASIVDRNEKYTETLEREARSKLKDMITEERIKDDY